MLLPAIAKKYVYFLLVGTGLIILFAGRYAYNIATCPSASLISSITRDLSPVMENLWV